MTRMRIMFVGVLLFGAAGVAATYFFGIVPRLASYEEVKSEEAQLRKRVAELETAFNGVKPQRAIGAWSEQVQPWTAALSDRLNYFDSVDQLTPIVVPEEERDFPKFYYREKLPELMNALDDDAYNAGTTIPTGTFGAPAPRQVGNPTVEEVEGWLNDFQAGAEFVRIVIDTKAERLEQLTIADPVGAVAVPEGRIQLERVRYQLSMDIESFARFLEDIHEREKYFGVTGFHVAKRALADPQAPMQVELEFVRTRFIPNVVQTASGEEAAPLMRRVSARPGGASASAAARAGRRPEYTEEQLARIRAAVADTNPSFFRSILRWFGL